MTQLLINESDSLQSISRASATAAAAAAAAAVAATGRISHHDNNNNDRNNCGNIGCGGRGSSSNIHTMSNNDNDNHQSYNDRILDIGVGDGMLILPPPTNMSVVSYTPHCIDNNDRSDPPGENATTAYMEVECFVDTTTTAKNSNKNMDNNNNNKRLLPLSLSLKKYDNMTNNNTFDDDDDDDDDVDNDDLGTVISCREIVPKQQSFSETKKTMSSSLPLDDTNPSKLIRGKSYIVNAETLDLVTLPTDESNKIDNNMSLLNNKSNNYTANDVITTDDLVVESTTAAAIVKRKSLISSIFSRKKSLKKESSSLESSTSKQSRSSSSSSEWREFTDVTTGRKYYSNGIMSSWENPALSTPMSNTTSQKFEKKETKKQRSRSTPPKSSTMTSKPTSSSHLASSSSSSRPRRSKSSPPKQPSASNAPVYSTTTTNNNTIVETNNDDDDQALVSKLTFIPDGNVEINDSYFSSIVKGYRLSTQSFHLPPPVQPPHPVSSPIVYGVATPPSSKIRTSSINTTLPLRKGCTVKNAAGNAAANSSKQKKMTLQVLQHQYKPTMTTDEVVANVDQSSATRPVIVGMGKSFESSDIVPSFHNSMKKAAKVDEQKTDIAAAAVAKPFSQCTKEAPVLTKTADVTVGRPMENSNIQSSNVVGSTYEHFQFVLTDSSGCDEHTRLAIDRNNYNTNNMMIRLPYNPNTTFYDLRCELMEDYPNEIAQLLPNNFKFTMSSSSTNGGLTISYIQEQKWKVREYYDLTTQSGNG